MPFRDTRSEARMVSFEKQWGQGCTLQDGDACGVVFPSIGQQIVHVSIQGYLSCLQAIVADGSRWTSRTFVTTPPPIRHTSRLPCSAALFRRLAIQPLFFSTAGSCPTRLNLHVLLEVRSARRSPASLHGGCTCTASSDPDSSPRHPFPPRPLRKRQLDPFDHVTRRRTPLRPVLIRPIRGGRTGPVPCPSRTARRRNAPLLEQFLAEPQGAKGGIRLRGMAPFRLGGVPRSSFVSKISSPSTVPGSVGWTTIGRTMPGDHVRDRRFPPTQDRSILAVRKSFLFLPTVDLYPEVPAHRSFAPRRTPWSSLHRPIGPRIPSKGRPDAPDRPTGPQDQSRARSTKRPAR